jgi:adenylate cyclase
VSDRSQQQRRLATIVAIDVAGFSRRVEADETGTLHDVSVLAALIKDIAARHGGRVFNTAGDGFMLEFPTVTGALEAAEAVNAEAGLSVRIGVHIGEVAVTGDSDLLGHGVNVAARLQARAPLKGILVSSDVVRAVRGDLAKRFRPCGVIKLDKMRETLPVFTFEPAGGPGQRPRLTPGAGRLPVLLTLIAILAAVAAAGGAWWALSHRGAPAAAGGHPADPRFAAQRFEVLGDSDAELRKFTDGLQAEMIDHLGKSRIDVVSAQTGGAAAYAFQGSVEREAGQLVVRIQLNDERQHVTVWTEDVRDDAGRAEILQDAVATLAAQVASTAEHQDALAQGDTDAMSLMIRSTLYAYRNRQEDREAEWDTQKLLLAKFPGAADNHANFAVLSAFLAASSTPERAAELRAVTVKEAAAALAINPHDKTALLARSLLFPLVGHWRQREAELLAGLKASPQSAAMMTHESNLLREVGRLEDALRLGRQAAAPKPPSANREATLLLAAAADGQTGEAAALADADIRAWPTDPVAWNARLQALLYQERWSDALALFAPGAYRPVALSPAEAHAWTLALNAMASGGAGARRKAATAMAALSSAPSDPVLPPHVIYSPGVRIAMLAILGDKDAAFAQARAWLRKDAYADSSFLFWPNLTALREDPRFVKLATDIGLVDYWKSTGIRPDFCADAGAARACGAMLN